MKPEHASGATQSEDPFVSRRGKRVGEAGVVGLLNIKSLIKRYSSYAMKPVLITGTPSTDLDVATTP